MRLILYAPAVDEETAGNEESADTHHIQSVFGAEVAARHVLMHDFVAVVNVNELADERSDA